MPETIRTFIALEIETQIQNVIDRIQSDLKKSGADVKWVKSQNVHLTLKFLGDVSVDLIEKINEAVESSVTSLASFDMEFSHLGAFPKIERPQVIWLGLSNGETQLKELASRIEEKLVILSFEKEKRAFMAHATLGRMRSGVNAFALSKMIRDYKIPGPLVQTAKTVSFFKSTLTPKGPIYEVIKSSYLKNP